MLDRRVADMFCVAGANTPMSERNGAERPWITLTGRELAVLAVAFTVLLGAVLLLVVASHQVTGALAGHG